MHINFLDKSWCFIFDMDGLMLDSEQLSNRAWIQAAADLGYRLTEQILLECVGRSLAQFEKTQKKYLGEDYPFERVWDLKTMHFEELSMTEGIPLKDGLLPLLDLLEERGIRKAVASSTRNPQVEKRLKRTGVFDRFEIVVDGSMVTHAKPAPDLFLETAKLLNVNPQTCLVLEDSPYGVEAAIAAGMPVILVPDLVEPPKEIQTKVVGVFDSLEQVRLYLLENNI